MDFKKSLSAGLDAAKKARSNKDEINGVINDLSRTISDFSKGMISLEITKERKIAEDDNKLLAAAVGIGSLANLNSFKGYKEYQALSLVRNSNGNKTKRKIAEWSLNDSQGYPCIISYNKQDVRCTTKDTLAKALYDLASDARTGESLLELMELQDE